MTGRLPRSFYDRPATEVAPALLGAIFVRRLHGGSILAARIVETEAYESDDPASHAFRGPTPRNRVMFGPAGHLYVYFTYGMHFCMNVVTRGVGEGSAVLLRAAEPVEGVEEMLRRRGAVRRRDLCRGPARFTKALSVGRGEDGEDLVRGGVLWIEADRPAAAADIVSGARVGVSVGQDREWRFSVRGDPHVSVWRPGRRSVSRSQLPSKR